MKKYIYIFFILTLLSDSDLNAVELFSWGFNSNGQLGDGTTVNRTSPVQIGSETDWKMINCGSVHNAAIKSDGTLWTWGFNGYGQLGDGTTTDRHSPVQVGSDSDWSQVDCGSYHTVAIKKNGTLWAWGDNFWGQIGDQTKTNRINPVKIGNSSNWAYVACGYVHTLAIKSDGTLWAWGDNDYGKLGDSTTIDKVSPVKIGSSNNWLRVSGGGDHTIALKTDGTLWAWGFNYWGQIGDNSTTDRYSPLQIGSQTDWKLVDCGQYHSLAIKSDGTLWTWGYNGQGRLGDGTNTNRHSSVQIGNETNWLNVSGGGLQSIGIKNDGSVWTWGYNNLGQLGDGTTVDRYSPVRVGSSNEWADVSCGYRNSVCLFGVSEPEVKTGSITDITGNSALCGANVVNDGGRNVTARGVCWATSENPTIANNYTLSGTGIGSFSSNITGLNSNTKYYVRAFATNSLGTSYGEQKSFQTLQKQLIPLASGWNLISSYINPENTSIPVVWDEVKHNIVIVKNNAGATYIPAFDIDQIINWNVSEGYQVYASLADTLHITGSQVVPESSPVILSAGWNIISYLRNSELDCEIAFASITDNDNLVIVKDNFGNTYIPAYDINGIGNLIPGQGYQIYVLNNDQLIYPEN